LKPLSFVIITYNRPAEMLALARNISGLRDASSLLEEVIILNNASTENYEAVKSFIQATPQIPFKWLEAPSNLGVARGRNYALRSATAPILIMLDDDAELENEDALIQLVSVYNQSQTDRKLAIVSFKVLYFDNHQMQINALPHKNFREYSQQSFFETYYFAGGAHAIRKDVIDQLGMYPEDFFYGMEEYDLGYRLLDAGFAIVYSDKVVMLHKESPGGRKPKKEKIQMMWVNKSKVAWRYLPKKYFYSTAILWSFQYLAETGFHLAGFFEGWKKITQIPKTEIRKPLKPETLVYLKKLKARLYY